MSLNKLILGFIVLGALACAKAKPAIISPENLLKQATVTQVNGVTAVCIVSFYEVANPSVGYILEAESIVACNGHIAILSGTSYSATFPNSLPNPVLLSVIRPQAGATTAEFVAF